MTDIVSMLTKGGQEVEEQTSRREDMFERDMRWFARWGAALLMVFAVAFTAVEITAAVHSISAR